MRLEREAGRSDEAGYTLVELLVVMVLSIFVIGVPLTLAVTSFKAENTATSRSSNASTAQVGVDRLMRDLRSATSAVISSNTAPATAVLQIPTRQPTGTTPMTGATALPPTTVTWTCATATSGTAGAAQSYCTRQVAGRPAEQVIRGVSTATFTPAFAVGAVTPNRVDVSITTQILDQDSSEGQAGGSQPPISLKGATPVTFTDGVDLRNAQ